MCFDLNLQKMKANRLDHDVDEPLNTHSDGYGPTTSIPDGLER